MRPPRVVRVSCNPCYTILIISTHLGMTTENDSLYRFEPFLIAFHDSAIHQNTKVVTKLHVRVQTCLTDDAANSISNQAWFSSTGKYLNQDIHLMFRSFVGSRHNTPAVHVTVGVHAVLQVKGARINQ